MACDLQPRHALGLSRAGEETSRWYSIFFEFFLAVPPRHFHLIVFQMQTCLLGPISSLHVHVGDISFWMTTKTRKAADNFQPAGADLFRLSGQSQREGGSMIGCWNICNMWLCIKIYGTFWAWLAPYCNLSKSERCLLGCYRVFDLEPF